MNESDHPILVCGLGQVGYRVTLLLLQVGEKVVVVTNDNSRAEWLRILKESGVRIVIGDARDESILLDAGLMTAKSLIACTSNDLTNIEIALDVKRYRPDVPIVARMFDGNLADQVEKHLGVQQALAVSLVSAPAFASAAFGDHVTGEFETAGRRFIVSRLEVKAEDAFVSWDLGKFQREFDVAVLMYVPAEGEPVIDPPADTAIGAGDVFKVLGTSKAMRRFMPEFTRSPRAVAKAKKRLHWTNPVKALGHLWRSVSPELRAVLIGLNVLTLVSVFVFSWGMGLSLGDAFYFVIATVTTTGYGDISPKDASMWLKLYACLMMVLGSASVAVLYSIVTDYIVTARLQQLVGRQKAPDSGHVVVAGMGDVGYRVVEELERLGVDVVAIDADGANKYLATIRSRIPVIVGDARNQETLLRAGVDRAIATIATTGDDAVNLSIGLASEAIEEECRSIVRLFDGNFAQKVQSLLQIDVAMSASRIAAPAFVSAALYARSAFAFVLRDHLFCVIEGPAATTTETTWTVGIRPDGRLDREITEPAIRIVVRSLKPRA